MAVYNNLYRLLDLNPENEEDKEKLDGDAILQEVKKNPFLKDHFYTFLNDEGACLPILQAIKLNAPLTVIEALSSHRTLRETDDSKCNVLHLALRYKASMDVLVFLLEQKPNLVEEKDIYGEFPLHTACYNKSPLEVVSFLIECWPDALKGNRICRGTPLHYACKKKAPFEVVSLLVEHYPDALKMKSLNDETPLHLACEHQEPLIEVVSLLIERWPDALREKAMYDYTPLHLVCVHEAPIEVVSLIVKRYPDGLGEKAGYACDFTPLHIACRNQPSLAMVSLLIEHYPDALREKLKSCDYLPLHVACRKQASCDVVAALIEKHPEATTEREKNGELPLDLAITYDAPEDTQKLLLHVTGLFNDKEDNKACVAEEATNFFTEIEWWSGILLVLVKYPTVITQTSSLHIKTIPDLLSMVGHCCNIKTMWKILCEKQDLFKDI